MTTVNFLVDLPIYQDSKFSKLVQFINTLSLDIDNTNRIALFSEKREIQELFEFFSEKPEYIKIFNCVHDFNLSELAAFMTTVRSEDIFILHNIDYLKESDLKFIIDSIELKKISLSIDVEFEEKTVDIDLYNFKTIILFDNTNPDIGRAERYVRNIIKFNNNLINKNTVDDHENINSINFNEQNLSKLRFLNKTKNILIGLFFVTFSAMIGFYTLYWFAKIGFLVNKYSPSEGFVANLGYFFAELSIRYVGCVSPLLAVPGIIFGTNLIVPRIINRPHFRAAVWMLGCILGTGPASAFTKLSGWPLATGFGGLVGDLILERLNIFLNGQQIYLKIIITIIMVFSISCFIISMRRKIFKFDKDIKNFKNLRTDNHNKKDHQNKNNATPWGDGNMYDNFDVRVSIVIGAQKFQSNLDLEDYQYYLSGIVFGDEVENTEVIEFEQSEIEWRYRKYDDVFELSGVGNINIEDLNGLQIAKLNFFLEKHGNVDVFVQIEFKMDGESMALLHGREFKIIHKAKSIISKSTD